MAIHLLECAAHTNLPASKKLALMAIADDADKESRVGRAGLDAVMAWSGLKKSRALEVIAELVTEGFLRRESGGYIGHRAEFMVFPDGCCALHGPTRKGSARPDASPKPKGSAPSDANGSATADPQPEQEGPIEGPTEGPTATAPAPGRSPNENGSDAHPSGSAPRTEDRSTVTAAHAAPSRLAPPDEPLLRGRRRHAVPRRLP
jgi:hypothetical protein